LSVPLISIALHFFIFNRELVGIHVWRQTETQQVIDNFYRDDFNILNPRINGRADTNQLHRMEFPVFQWLVALMFRIFGRHIIVSRSVVFVLGLGAVWGMYHLARGVFNNKGIAAVCAWCFNFSPVFYYYALNPIPDIFALACSIWSISFFQAYISSRRRQHLLLSAAMLGLATLAKLPYILYGSFVLGYVVVAIQQRLRTGREIRVILLTFFCCCIPALLWYSWVMPGWENGTIKGIFQQNLSHRTTLEVLWGTLVSVLPELLINYGSVLFFACGLYLAVRNRIYVRRQMIPFLAWATVIVLYFLYEVNLIELVHDYYLLPFLPPIFLLVAYGARWLLMQNKLAISLAFLCLAILPLTAFLRTYSRWDTAAPGFDAAYYKYETALRSLTPPHALCITYNDESSYILLYYIDRKGWSVPECCLDEQTLTGLIDKGARYLFLDTHIDTVTVIRRHLGNKIFDRDNLRVYELKPGR